MNIKKPVKWEFWFSLSEYGGETIVETKEYKQPERTKVWKGLVLKFNKGECKRIGYKHIKTNLSYVKR